MPRKSVKSSPSAPKKRGPKPNPVLLEAEAEAAAVVVPQPAQPSRFSQRDSGQLVRMEVELEAQLRVVKRARTKAAKLKDVGGFDKDVANAAATLARSMATLNTERRRQEKHEAELVMKLEPDEWDTIIIDYIREATPDRQKRYLEAITEIVNESSLLAIA